MPDATGIPATAASPGDTAPQVGDPDVEGVDEEQGRRRRSNRSPKTDVPAGEEENAPDGGG
jgi:hypothetical protein